MLHTLGFYHMQSSPDRDDYIDVMWENIIKAARHNFRKYNSFAVSDFGVGYDYESVLHYSRKAFSVNGQDTLVPKKSGAGIGQRIGLSEKDVMKLNKMYCDADSDLVLDSDTDKETSIKKKLPKNKPFQGQGIGYHQGKAVAIKLPAAQTFYLRHPSDIHMFNYFSKAKETVPAPAIQGFGIAKEMKHTNDLLLKTYPVGSVPDIIKVFDEPNLGNDNLSNFGKKEINTKYVNNNGQGNSNQDRQHTPTPENSIQPILHDHNYQTLPLYYVNSHKEPLHQMQLDEEPNRSYEYENPLASYGYSQANDERNKPNIEEHYEEKYTRKPYLSHRYYPVQAEDYTGTRPEHNFDDYSVEPKRQYETINKNSYNRAQINSEAQNIYSFLRPQGIHYSRYLI
ncbi:uncharacterized protein LOC126965678 isoform X2 [Leptidea sinapis]|nr:uncharacterized protein LOC126965678 isoform X2 [Leptidea sinapis]